MYVPVGRWILVSDVVVLSPGYVSALVVDAGPLGEVEPGQMVMLDATLQGSTDPLAWPREALVARTVDGEEWLPEPGWAIVDDVEKGWMIVSSRVYGEGVAVVLVTGSAIPLSEPTHIVAERDIIATTTL